MLFDARHGIKNFSMTHTNHYIMWVGISPTDCTVELIQKYKPRYLFLSNMLIKLILHVEILFSMENSIVLHGEFYCSPCRISAATMNAYFSMMCSTAFSDILPLNTA